MKDVLLILLFGGAGVLISCNKDEEITPYTGPEIPYLLVSKIQLNTDSTSGVTQTFSYNIDLQVDSIETIAWGYNDDVEAGWRDTSMMTFTYANHKVVGAVFETPNGKNGYRFEYAGDYLKQWVLLYPENEVYETNDIVYDGERISNITSYRDGGEILLSLKYKNGNLSSVLRSNNRAEKYEWYKYDNYDEKLNYFHAINGFPKAFQLPYSQSQFDSYSENNALYRKSNYTGGLPSYWEGSMTYTSYGLPETMQYSNQTIVFTYLDLN